MQNKFEVDILKNVAKIANLRPKIGQIPLLSLDINWQNSIIFYPILTFFILNCLFLRDESNGVQIKALSLLVKILVFGPIFAPRPHIGKIVAWTQNHPKKVGTCPGLPLQSVSHNQSFQNYRPEPPPPPPPPPLNKPYRSLDLR